MGGWPLLQIELLVAFGYLSIIPLYLKSIVQHCMFFSQHICSKFPVLIMLQVHPWDVWDWWYIRVFLFLLFFFLAKLAGMKDLCSPERSRRMPITFFGSWRNSATHEGPFTSTHTLPHHEEIFFFSTN